MRHRTQLLLDPAQYQALNKLAKIQGRSISDVVREFVDQGLALLENSREQKLSALAELEAIRARLESRIGTYPGEPVAEVRAERARSDRRSADSRPFRMNIVVDANLLVALVIPTT